MIATSKQLVGTTPIGANIRRLMAREGLTYEEIVAASGLDERTIRGLVRGTNTPHARTLHKLAAGLGVEVDELFRPVGPSPAHQFDRATNVLVDSVVIQRPEIFADWSEAEFAELYSRFGAGGALSEEGIVAAAQAMNDKRALWTRFCVILESDESQHLAEFVEMLYRRVTEPPTWSK
jgi:transcriptional regulator with XRE-family HTH domain